MVSSEFAYRKVSQVRNRRQTDQLPASSSSAYEMASSSVMTRPFLHASSHASSPMPERTADIRASASARKSMSLGMHFASCRACAAPHSRPARSVSPSAPATQANPSKALCTSGFIAVSHEREALSVEISSPAEIVLQQGYPSQVAEST